MKTVRTIKFAVPVNRVLRNGSDLSFFDLSLPEANYVKVEYDGTDFLITNLEKGETTYVAKTNVSQWKLDDSTDSKAKGSSKGAGKKASEEAHA